MKKKRDLAKIRSSLVNPSHRAVITISKGFENEMCPTVISIDNAELGWFCAGERIFRRDSRRAGPVSRLLVLGAGESHGAIVAVIPEC